MDPFIGEIRMVAFNYPPQDWASCNGMVITIQQNPALYTIIGTTYGSSSYPTQSFKLPNFSGCVPSGAGQNPALPYNQKLGQQLGSSVVTLSGYNTPSHSHTVSGNLSPPDLLPTPAPNALLNGVYNNTVLQKAFAPASATPSVDMHPSTIGPWGSPSPAPHENRQPYQALNFIICLYGNYPDFN
ncbi:MAG: tail fiber protein [Magnetococcales bacterium]|nr:tail fiber protein [Magnetococcales bacterium]